MAGSMPSRRTSTSVTASADGVRIAVPIPASAEVKDAFFFPVTVGAIDYAAPQKVTRDGDVLTIATKGKPSGPIEGVLRIGDGLGLAVKAAPGVLAQVAPTESVWITALVAFAGAVLGKIVVLCLLILFIQRRPRGLFPLKGRAVET